MVRPACWKNRSRSDRQPAAAPGGGLQLIAVERNLRRLRPEFEMIRSHSNRQPQFCSLAVGSACGSVMVRPACWQNRSRSDRQPAAAPGRRPAAPQRRWRAPQAAPKFGMIRSHGNRQPQFCSLAVGAACSSIMVRPACWQNRSRSDRQPAAAPGRRAAPWRRRPVRSAAGLLCSRNWSIRTERAAASPRKGPHFASRRSARAGPSARLRADLAARIGPSGQRVAARFKMLNFES